MKTALTPLLTAIVAALFFASCDDAPVAGQSGDERSAFEAGKDLLFSAPTRFEYPKAVELLQQAVAQDNADPSIRVNLVYALLKRGQYERAETHVKAAKTLRATLSDREDLWLDALAAKVQDDVSSEVAHWETVVEAYPEDRWAWYELASARSAVPDYAGAARAAEKASSLESDPEKWEASWLYYLHSKALFRSGQYEAAIAAAAPGEATPTTWRSGFFRKALGQVMAGKADSDALVEDYIKISNEEGRNNTSYTLSNIALFRFEAGEYDKAVAAAREAYELEPKAYQSWTLAYLLAENNQAADAVDIATKAADAFPQHPTVLASKGWALYRAGRFEEARRSLLEAKRYSKRRSYQIERDLKIVQTAVDFPDTPPAPVIPWLG